VEQPAELVGLGASDHVRHLVRLRVRVRVRVRG
jgi:hypothetical protein